MRSSILTIRVACLVAAALAGLAVVAQQEEDRFAEVEIKATHVAGSVHVLEGYGGNIGVSVGGDGILIVDDQFAPLAEKIRAALGKLGEGRLRFVLNTHWHGDHTGGNPVFGPEAPIIAHDNVRERLASRQEVPGRVTEPMAAQGLPVITFAEGLSVHFNGEEIRVIHLDHAHTDGDSIVWFTGSNVVHLGDILFDGLFPFVDLESGGDVQGLAEHLADLLDLLPPDVKLIPGHGGPVATMDDLRAFRDMVVRTTDIVRGRIAQGMILDEIKAAGLPEEWASWNWPFISTETWLEIIHSSLTRDR